MIKLLIVDDSSFMRSAIKSMVANEPEIQVVGEAKNGKEGLELVESLQPDLITLDIEMPICDGLTMLEQLMKTNPTPVIMLSSLTTEGAESTLRALDLGALDFMPKYKDNSFSVNELQAELCEKIKQLSRRGKFMRKSFASPSETSASKTSSLGTSSTTSTTSRFTTATSASPDAGSASSAASAFKSRFTSPMMGGTAPGAAPVAKTSSLNIPTGKPKRRYIGIGISTGGPPAIQKVLEALPKDFKGSILVAQHMPASFTAAFAQRLNNLCAVEVREAKDGEHLADGVVYVSPGGQHIRLEAKAGMPTIVVSPEPTTALYKPSANELFESLSHFAPSAVGVMMTGMGSDGLEGMKIFKQKGGKTIAQNESSCVVYGMPKAVIDAKIVDEIADVNKIAQLIIDAMYS